ncbi:hypothetical protein HUW51_02950 [Adhaeribacter swui]|uniref:Uncharacterized protein n=1 Tax=Adhaeribacter swui TaxID=2086471 RepID=A0A7G7G3J4_9BACT|nr:hypothetical protein [Adhaeribacter swui]QNF31728.1 hypothetical protein HUW51_02950 [Adhaeribacter swui]
MVYIIWFVNLGLYLYIIMFKPDRSYLPVLFRNGITSIGVFLPVLLIYLVLLTSCNSGKIPCPKIGNKRGLAFFKKKADPTIPNQEGFGQSKPTSYDKNGLMKKKSYKSLKQKPKRLKSV